MATVLHAGEGEQVGGATAVTIKAGGEQTGDGAATQAVIGQIASRYDFKPV